MQAEEMVDIVDDHDRVIRQVTRSQMRREVLLHRVVAVLCTNSRGEIFVHQRTATKDLFPSLYDMFAAGTVEAGERYEETAERELAEELGVRGAKLERLFHHLYQGPSTRAHTEVYRVIWDGPIVTQPSEIAWGEFRTREAILANRDGFAFVPDGAELFARYVQLY
jgi:8-oxo-dGTP pyrophosphatase MutT (NUDIX family)